ncbi:nuclear transport factor 2 family protein [Roseateles albus]|uniref:Nuclear transport factor 2 family protein n=1 Tax=Roseateles albus TaxID=2987525 RepID=A0ABT5KGL4_9BURK|nr:nuclear transport factor 2 family protein [Roseateles albus]MDC8772532.1 nuclear transport factor 2 family protein [Roseateles albus]
MPRRTPVDSVQETLQALECELHQPKARADAGRLAELLHADFREFGRSGRAYNRAEIMASLTAETKPVTVHAQDFKLTELGLDVYLLSYRSAHLTPDGGLVHHTNRSSIWRLTAAGWQMVFHQGTPTAEFGA